MTALTVEDYTQQKTEEEGDFRGFPVAWTLEQSTKSKAVAIAFKFAIHSKWHGADAGWSEQYPVGYYVEHRAWVIGSDGELNPKAVKSLADAGLWNGDFDEVAGPVKSVFVLLVVEQEAYENNKPESRAKWVNPDAPEPRARGQFSPADPSLLNDLRARFSGKAKAIAGGTPAGPASAPAPAAAIAPATATPAPANVAATPATPATPAAPSAGAAATVAPAVASPTPAAAPTPAAGVAPPQNAQPPATVAPPNVAPPVVNPATGPADPDDPMDVEETPF